MLRRLEFSLWYFFRPPWDSGISPPELFDFMEHHAAGRAIDLGCGTGTNMVTLAQHGWQVTGIDFAPRAIQIAKRKLAKAGVRAEIRTGDVTQLKGISGPFDLALDLGCFHGIHERGAYLKALRRVLAQEGYWLMYGRLRTDPEASGPGLKEDDIELIKSSGLQIINRKNSWDKRGRRSAWFLFQHMA